jgi:hypothetical protein
MTDLEERLAGAGGVELREALMARAAGLEARLRAQLAASVPRSEYADLAACADAARAAHDILRDWPSGRS